MTVSNLKKFRIYYNKLDDLLEEKTKIKRHGSFIQKLNQFLKEHPSFSWLKEEIRLIHDLRNVIIHEEKYKQDIAIPTESFLHKISQIIQTIERPQTAFDISSQRVFKCEPNDKLKDVVDTMSKNHYSVVPVFEKKRECRNFLGVFSENVLVTIASDCGEYRDNNFWLPNITTIKDVLEYVKAPIRESWDFIARDTDVYNVQQLFHTKTFTNAALEKSRLGVLFVTKNGSPDEKFLGLITPWDLSKIEQYPKIV